MRILVVGLSRRGRYRELRLYRSLPQTKRNPSSSGRVARGNGRAQLVSRHSALPPCILPRQRQLVLQACNRARGKSQTFARISPLVSPFVTRLSWLLAATRTPRFRASSPPRRSSQILPTDFTQSASRSPSAVSVESEGGNKLPRSCRRALSGLVTGQAASEGVAKGLKIGSHAAASKEARGLVDLGQEPGPLASSFGRYIYRAWRAKSPIPCDSPLGHIFETCTSHSHQLNFILTLPCLNQLLPISRAHPSFEAPDNRCTWRGRLSFILTSPPHSGNLT